MTVAAIRRARPLLGTLVEIAVLVDGESPSAIDRAAADAAIATAFDRIADVQRRLSRFDAASDVARFNAARAGASLAVAADTERVLAAAGELRDASDGAFDVTLGSGRAAWHCASGVVHKASDAVRIDLGGIGKGYAVDVAVEALIAAGVEAGWVNAGGDLRVFGAATVPVDLRDEDAGGVRRFAQLGDGAFATSRLATGDGALRHASVAAPSCLWADALTKLVVARGDTDDPLLARYGARAWLHEARPRAAERR